MYNPLARDIVADKPLPWQKPMAKLTPGRVAQAMGWILAAIDTPASAPQPRGKSPRWIQGQARLRRTRYPVVKKTTSKARKQHSKFASFSNFPCLRFLAHQLNDDGLFCYAVV
jgi:hypothetical protein